MSGGEANEEQIVGNPRLPTKRFRETPDVTEGALRMIHRIGRRVGEEDPGSLTLLRALEDGVVRAWELAIADLRTAGYSDSDIARELGISRQAVSQRWPRADEQ